VEYGIGRISVAFFVKDPCNDTDTFVMREGFPVGSDRGADLYKIANFMIWFHLSTPRGVRW